MISSMDTLKSRQPNHIVTNKNMTARYSMGNYASAKLNKRVSIQPQNHNNLLHQPRFAIKSDLLYDATSTINLGIEVALAKQWTIELSANYNPWIFSDNRKMKHLMFQPEVRWWPCQRFSGHFIGIHGNYGIFNWGGMLPWGFNSGKTFGTISNPEILQHRFEGWLLGGGFTYGHHWAIGGRWGMEASVGLGYAYMKFDKFNCIKCGDRLKTDTKHYIGPTKIGITLVYNIK